MPGWHEVTIGQCRLICGDARAVIAAIETSDVLITDMPYGVGLTRKHNDYRQSKYFDDGASLQASRLYEDSPETVATLIAQVIIPLLHIVKRAALFPGNRMLRSYPQAASIGTIFVGSGAGCDPWGFGCNNPILYYGKDPYLATGKGSRPNSFAANQPGDDSIDHPCPKPLSWMRWLVNRASLPGECVIDPFAGSFTTAVACVQLGRPCIAIELDPYYWEQGCRRVEAAYAQLDLMQPQAWQAPQQLALVGR